MANKHSDTSPSTSDRWLNCAASVSLIKLLPKDIKPDSEPARQGRATHKLAEVCLKTGQSPEVLLGKNVRVEDTVFGITEDMTDVAGIYVDFVKTFIDDKDFISGIEEKVYLKDLYKGLKEVYGTVDFWAYSPVKKELFVVDLKSGFVPVSAVGNTQLNIYALGAMAKLCSLGFLKLDKTFWTQLRSVKLITVRPAVFRHDIISKMEVTPENLRAFFQETLVLGIDKVKERNPKFNAGSWCKYCPGSIACKTFEKYLEEMLSFSFKEVPLDLDIVKLEPAVIARKLSHLDIIVEQLNMLKEYVRNQKMKGVDFPGYKLVHGPSRRKWFNEKKAKDILEKSIGKACYEPKKLISVAKAEAVYKKLGLDKRELENEYYKKEANLLLAKSTDKRKSVNLGDTPKQHNILN